jgi:tetratricopeptide (TPR) repeat protein/O-antigen ligase
MNKLGDFCVRVVEAGWLVILVTVPLYFDVYSTRVFEPDKTTYLRCLVLLMLLAQIVALSERPRTTAKPGSPGATDASGSLLRRVQGANPLLWPVVALAAAEILATATSILPGMSLFGSYQRLQGTYTFFTYLALFFLVATNLRTSAQLQRIGTVAILTSVPICLYGFIQHLQLDPLPWGGDVVYRVTSTMGNAIFLAAYLIIVAPLTAARLVGAARRATDPNVPSSGPVWRTVGLHTLLISGLVAIAGFPLVFHASISGIWWLAPGFIGAFVLVASLPIQATESRRLATIEALTLALALLVQLTCIFLTQSRGPWLGALAGGVIFVLLLETWSRIGRRMLVGTVAVLVALAAFLVVFNLPQSPLAPWRSVPYVGRLGQLSQLDDGTGRVRVLIWQGTYALLTQHPNVGFAPDPLGPFRLLVGYGPDVMHAAYNPVYPPALGDLESRNASPDRNHNDLLDHLVMTGIFGLLAYLGLVFAALRLGWLRLRRAKSLGEAALLAGLIAALVAHLAETQTGIAIVSTLTYFWVILAVLVALAVRGEALLGPGDGRLSALRPIAGGAPPAVKSKRPAASRRPSAVRPPPGQPAPRSSIPVGWWRATVIVVYVALVIVGQAVVASISAATPSGSGQGLAIASFVWLGLVLPAWALSQLPPARWSIVRGRSLWIAGVSGLAVALLLVLNLNQIAADVYHKQGTNLDDLQRYTDSVRSYTRAITLAPLQDYYYLYLGRAYMELAKQAPAQSQVAAFQPTLANVLTEGPIDGAQLSQLQALQSAEVVLERARDLDPLDPDHYANLARLNRLWGETIDKSRLDVASVFSAQATTLAPHSSQLFAEWALTSLAQNKLSDAEKHAQTAATLDPQYAVAHLVLGDVYLAEKQTDAAFTQHVEALKLDPTSLSDSSFEQRVATYLAAGKGSELAAAYQQAVAAQPNRTDRLAYGYVLSRSGQTAAAIQQFQIVARENGGDWTTQRSLAMLFQQAGDAADARAAAQAAIQTAPSDQASQLEATFRQVGLVGGP